MIKRIGLIIGILMILEACAPSTLPTPVPTETPPPVPSAMPTVTPIASIPPTDTPMSTVTAEHQPSETQSPTPTVAFFLAPATVRPTRKPTRTPTALPTDTPTATIELQSSETPSPDPTPTLPCETDTASASLSASTGSLKVGDAVILTVSIINEGCVALGEPQYRLRIQYDGQESIFDPSDPPPVVHYLAVALGQSDSADFELTAVASGQATLTASVSYEVHLGYPGPAYWGFRGTGEPLVITVTP